MKRLNLVIFVVFFLIAASYTSAAPIDINKANAEEIANTMQGIGIKKAEAIVAYRNSNGPFKNIADIAMVKGIGEKTVDMNKENITVISSE